MAPVTASAGYLLTEGNAPLAETMATDAETGQTYVCNVCQTRFITRNKLFKHLKKSDACAETGGLTAVEARRSNEEIPPGPNHGHCAKPKNKNGPVWAAIDSEQSQHAMMRQKAELKKVINGPKEKLKETGKLHLETRPEAYETELKDKVGILEQRFVTALQGEGEPLPSTEVFGSPPEHFRMRVEFDVFHKGSEANFVMFDGRNRVDVDSFPMGAKVISDVLMPTLKRFMHEEDVIRKQLFQANFHGTLNGEAMVILLYRTLTSRTERKARHDDHLAQQAAEDYIDPPKDVEGDAFSDEWVAAATRLRDAFCAGAGAEISVVGRVKGHKKYIGKDYVEEKFEVPGAAAPLRYHQLDGFFSQPNAAVCRHMLAWARAVAASDDAAIGQQVAKRTDDLLELYCGNGNFSIALAPFFRQVLATELVKVLVDTALINAELNNVDTVAFGRVSAEELAEALAGGRSFSRLVHIDLPSYQLNTVLVDPPRAGLGKEVSHFLTRFQRIVYISCNPTTLLDDLAILRKTHAIKRLAVFDQFPYTDHLEMGLLLVRRADV
eukprot:TRINITY_DN113019_c0_g1_i1.p1 TRINITY_DN113019_c0_g1~~TRINITY_DN113019_c0_g1_i1.p1  ORF type:complete len:552 (-),score=100.19 TRINITY_DN113019_c0_g1_i1:379-2034(-)